VKPHKSPPGKQDHNGKLSKKIKEAMEWDFEQFLNQIVERIRAGQTTNQIEAWIHPPNSTIKTRQIVQADVAGDWTRKTEPHPLGLCLVSDIKWRREGTEIVGFVIIGRMGRKAWDDPIECHEFPPMTGPAARQTQRTAALAASQARDGRMPAGLSALHYHWITGGSSSSSSSSSYWPR
jgi:hypothetical protein